MEEIKVVKGWNLISFKNDGILEHHNIVINTLYYYDNVYKLVEKLVVFSNIGYWVKCVDDGIIKNKFKLKENNILLTDNLPLIELEPPYIEDFKDPLGLLRNLTIHNFEKKWEIKDNLLSFNGFKPFDLNWEKTESWLFLPIQRNNIPKAIQVHCDIIIKGEDLSDKSSLEVWYSYNHKKLKKPDLNNWKLLFNLNEVYSGNDFIEIACDIPEIPTTYDDPAELAIAFRYISETPDQVGNWIIKHIDSHFH